MLEEASHGTHEYNTGKAVNKKVGFYGLDVYSLWESMMTTNRYLSKMA